jgi:hypothetical protein
MSIENLKSEAFAGEVNIKVYENGNLVSEESGHNTLNIDHAVILLHSLAGETEYNLNFLGVGGNGDNPEYDNFPSGLPGLYTLAPLNKEQTVFDDGQPYVVFKALLIGSDPDFDLLVGKTIREIGLYSSNGKMFSRYVLTYPKIFGPQIAIPIEYKIKYVRTT